MDLSDERKVAFHPRRRSDWTLPILIGCLIPLAFSTGHYFSGSAEPVNRLARITGLDSGYGVALLHLQDGTNEEAAARCPDGWTVVRIAEVHGEHYALIQPKAPVLRRPPEAGD